MSLGAALPWALMALLSAPSMYDLGKKLFGESDEKKMLREQNRARRNSLLANAMMMAEEGQSRREQNLMDITMLQQEQSGQRRAMDMSAIQQLLQMANQDADSLTAQRNADLVWANALSQPLPPTQGDFFAAASNMPQTRLAQAMSFMPAQE